MLTCATAERSGKGFQDFCLERWLKSRPEPGRDCDLCRIRRPLPASLALQRGTDRSSAVRPTSANKFNLKPPVDSITFSTGAARSIEARYKLLICN